MDLNAIMNAKLLRQDPPREGKQVRIKVVSTSSGVVIAGHVVNIGEHELLVHEMDVAAFEREVEDFVDAKGRKIDPTLVDRELEATEEAAKDPNATHRPYTPSYAAAFREVVKREMRPLRRVEVLGDKASKKAA